MPTKVPRSLGRYRLLNKVGVGGMGTVYLAEDTDTGQNVALKIPRFDGREGSPVLERFMREARIAADIRHPHLCPVYEYGQIDDTPYLTMPYIQGTPLSRLIAAGGAWEPLDALTLVHTLAEAFQVVHDKGIVHRDIKPSNVMVRDDGRPMIMDFGLARSYIEATKQLTSAGIALGTPSYMAPEQILESGVVGPATDVYSLGMILYELLAGRVAFEGTPTALFGQILHAPLLPPSHHNPAVDERLDALCLRALGRELADRFASMTEFAEAIQVEIDVLTPEPEQPTPAPVSVPAARQGRVVLSMRLTCPGCGRKLKILPGADERELFCPHCKTALEAPEELSWLQRFGLAATGVAALLVIAVMVVTYLLGQQFAFILCWLGLLVLGALALMLARGGSETDEEDEDVAEPPSSKRRRKKGSKAEDGKNSSPSKSGR